MDDEPKGAALLAAVLGSGREEVRLSPRQSVVLGRLVACATGELGCHLYRCADCGGIHTVAHSCRDRHCPRCQRAQAEHWLQRQRESLLPAPYFHVVFTLPHQLNDLVAQNPRRCLNLLFHAAGSTVMDFGRTNLGAQLGVSAVLHTWGQTMTRHYLGASATAPDPGPEAVGENGAEAPSQSDADAPVRICPHCGSARLLLVAVFHAPALPERRGRSPPEVIAA